MKVCSYCGRENEDIAEQCSGCGVDIEAKVQKLTKAGFGIRTLARIVDMVFFYLLAYLTGLAGALILIHLNQAGLLTPGWPQRLNELSYGGLALSFLAYLTYHFFGEGMHGATLGKLMFGLRVVQQDGSPSTFKGALIRSLAWPLDCFCFGLIAYLTMDNSPLNQRAGDVMGKIAVLKTSEIRPESKRTLWKFFAGLALGAIGCAIFLVLYFIYQTS